MSPVTILGAGPAGSSAAIAACRHDREVCLVEKSRFPRHKVCGEFFSPEIAPLLQNLGVWESFLASGPARIRNLELHFGSFDPRCRLPELAYGLSRYRFDDLLFQQAVRQGARHQPHCTADPTIVAHGRRTPSSRGSRLFGFKSHFHGPVNDSVELYFFSGCYVGINPVEDGITNICGLGPENLLRALAFDFDSVVNSFPKLSERLRPLTRTLRWLTVGPLVFQNRFRDHETRSQYPAGDALSFVDPFTGSGLLSAVLTGSFAGSAAARGTPIERYISDCRKHLQSPFLFSSLMRNLLNNGWAERLARFVPGHWLMRLTRPHV